MNLENSVEVTAESVDAAIRRGLEQLAAAPYEVIVEVLDEPMDASFGGEARPARVRLKRLSMPKPPMDPAAYSTPAREEAAIVFDRLPEMPLPDVALPPARREPARPPQANTPKGPRSEPRKDKPREGSKRDGRGPGDRDAKRTDRHAPLDEPNFASFAKADLPHNADYGVTDDEIPMFLDAELVPSDQQDDEAQVGKAVLETLLGHMSLTAVIEVRRAPVTEGEISPWVLNISGSRASTRLVGKRGETLAALQYLARLIASRELQRRAELIVDVDGYKARRAASLRTMALRLAEDAVAKQQVITLEPMPPHERRIVHLALRPREDVATRSIGEGRNRKVTIVPTGEGRANDG